MGNAPSKPPPSTSLPSSNTRPDAPPAEPEKCPIDPKSREAWLKIGQEQSRPLPPNHPTTSSTSSPEDCPIDHKSREAWLKIGQQQSTASSSSPATGPVRPRMTNQRLSSHREISTIPRALEDVAPPSSAPPPPPSDQATKECSSPSPNAQTPDPHTSASGTWVYPSEEMFFNAMKRKSFNPKEADMRSVIPIHNAVNERTWSEILRWEKPYNMPQDGSQGAPKKAGLCGGPKLVSFAGDSTKLSPRARWNMLMGYEKPFDRHDWVVDRCGTRVEYVIDYYQGKAPAGERGAKGPSFYLDVRPKLNSWEGIKMRMLRTAGFG